MGLCPRGLPDFLIGVVFSIQAFGYFDPFNWDRFDLYWPELEARLREHVLLVPVPTLTLITESEAATSPRLRRVRQARYGGATTNSYGKPNTYFMRLPKFSARSEVSRCVSGSCTVALLVER